MAYKQEIAVVYDRLVGHHYVRAVRGLPGSPAPLGRGVLVPRIDASQFWVPAARNPELQDVSKNTQSGF